MRFAIPHDLAALGGYIPLLLGLAGEKRWLRRVDHLDAEGRRSPFRWKIVSDYHWLEMAISFQSDVLAREGGLRPELTDGLILTALNFAATSVELHARLSPIGRQNLEGRLRDGLKAEAGFASLYLELDLAQRLMDAGFDVTFADMEGAARFDFLIRRGSFAGEVECKSLSANAGRQIHRKDFYRFMESISPELEMQRALHRREILIITLDGRLSPNTTDQGPLAAAIQLMLKDGTRSTLAGNGFELERQDFNASLPNAPISDPAAFYKACAAAFGPNPHLAGGLTEEGGCVVVMRSKRQDDTSKPMLKAMRKAASQFSREHPSFIAIQEHGIDAADLMLPHVQRRAGILSYALYSHYGASHVNAIYFTGFGAVVAREGTIGTPGFAISNPKAAFSVPAGNDPLLLAWVPEENYLPIRAIESDDAAR